MLLYQGPVMVTVVIQSFLKMRQRIVFPGEIQYNIKGNKMYKNNLKQRKSCIGDPKLFSFG